MDIQRISDALCLQNKKGELMKKVLVGFFMDGKSGGIDQYLLYFLRSVSSDCIQIDFLTNKIDPELQSILSGYGSRIFEIANLR